MATENKICGCCEGTEAITPQSTANRPGLATLSYRVGTHATFLQTMKARLSSHYFDLPGEASNGEGDEKGVRVRPLQDLKARDGGDPAIALMDAWATVADVLTLYQERIANEGYLRTATERRSVLELARLIGYALRPGVASSVWLALEIDKGYSLNLQPYDMKAQSLPGPGEMPQTFENIEALEAREAWNKLQPRLKQPQTIDSITGATGAEPQRIYLEGISTNLKQNDVVLITLSDDPHRLCWVDAVKADPLQNRTCVTFQVPGAPRRTIENLEIEDPLKKVVDGLTKKASIPPRSSLSLDRDLRTIFGNRTDTGLKMVGTFQPRLQQLLPLSFANAKVSPDSPIQAYAFRSVARPFGHNAPPRAFVERENDRKATFTSYKEWEIDDPFATKGSTPNDTPTSSETQPDQTETAHTTDLLYLDGEYNIKSDGWAVVKTPDSLLYLNLTAREAIASQQSLAAYGMSGKATSLKLKNGKEWYEEGAAFDVVRRSIVYVESEELPLADEPIDEPICGDNEWIELDGLYSGLQSGRWLIVAGERADILDETDASVPGVKAAELMMLAEVTQGLPGGSNVLWGDRTHTFIKLVNKLQYCYRRDNVTIYGNVLKATHGETRAETLGSGNAGQSFQSFAMKQPPVTYVAAPTPAGAESTLKVYVNDVQWHETETLADRQPSDRIFTTKTDDNGKTAVIFGNGQHGLRLPTGIENVYARYRNGLGKAGNVQAEQISQLISRPLGLKGVVNPLRASGGADRESRDTARQNAPRTVTALDRLVSVADYADFACTFAGIGKAVAAKITDGRRQWVHVTIAGADDIPIDETSDLYRNLLQALHDYGDPYQPVFLQVCELMFLLIKANVCITADYQWETVATAVRSVLLEAFSFERRNLGQDVVLSEVIAVIQSVSGVAYVDVDVLGGIPEKITDPVAGKLTRRLQTPQEISGFATQEIVDPGQPKKRLPVNLADFDKAGVLHPAQLAYLSPDVADTLVINQVKPI